MPQPLQNRRYFQIPAVQPWLSLTPRSTDSTQMCAVHRATNARPQCLSGRAPSYGTGRCHRSCWRRSSSRRSAGDENHSDRCDSGRYAGVRTGELARPDGNTTGVSILAFEAEGKRQDILIEAVPGLRLMAVLTDVNYAKSHEQSTCHLASLRRNSPTSHQV
jgi:hypothetical protein